MTENLETTVAGGSLTGLDRNDPKIRATAILAAIAGIALLAFVIAAQAGFRQIHPDQPASKAADLRTLRASEDEQLTSYRYIDRAKGTVALPVDRAMELLVKEAAEGKLPYSTEPTEIPSGREGK
jgi:hypothetical protein